jgi:alkaline phosphatase D
MDFPKSTQRMYDLIKRSEKPGIMFLSGDIHCAELMKNSSSSLNYPIYEFTSSGLTHGHWGPGIKENAYKIQNPFCAINYGLMTINWKEPVSLKVEMKDIQNFTAQEITIFLDDLKFKASE